MTTTTPPWWMVGDRRIVADFHPSIKLATVIVASALGLAIAAVLWWWDMPALSTLTLLAVAAFASGCFYLPLDHVAIGEDWAANGPLHRPTIIEVTDIRSIEVPELLDFGVPVMKLVGTDRIVRIDVTTLYRHAGLGSALLALAELAVFHGAELDREATQVIETLRSRHR